VFGFDILFVTQTWLTHTHTHTHTQKHANLNFVVGLINYQRRFRSASVDISSQHLGV